MGKGKGEKKGLTVTSLGTPSIAQIETTKISKKKEEVKTDGTLDELKNLKKELESNISETKSKIDSHDKKIDNKVIQQTATKNEIEDVKNNIKTTSTELVQNNNTPNAQPTVNNYSQSSTQVMTNST